MFQRLKYVLNAATVVAILVGWSTSNAQIHGPGPSDPNLFDDVFNLPPFSLPASSNLADDLMADEFTQVNVSDGGRARND